MSKVSNLNCEIKTAGSCTPAAVRAAPKAAPVRTVAMVCSAAQELLDFLVCVVVMRELAWGD